MADTENAAENPDNFAEEIIETGVVRKTVRKSYIIQEVSIREIKKTCLFDLIASRTNTMVHDCIIHMEPNERRHIKFDMIVTFKRIINVQIDIRSFVVALLYLSCRLNEIRAC